MIQEKDMHPTRPMGDNFFHILSILIIFRCNFSLSTYIPQYTNTIQLGLFAIWYVLAIFRNKDMFHYTLKVCWPLIVFLCINITIDDLFFAEMSITTKNYILIFMIFQIYLSYSFENDRKYKKIMLMMIVVEFLFVSFNTMKELALNPFYSRQLASSIENVDFKGVAGYSHIYAYTIMICTFVFLLVCKNLKLIHKTCLILIVSLGVILLFKASYMISILIVLSEILYCILFKNTNRSVIKTIISLTIIILLILLSARIFDWVYDLIDSDLIKDKLDDISSFFRGEGDSHQTEGRLYKLQVSFETFRDNFFWGIYGTKKYGAIGNHSGLLDMLAMFGIFRGGLFVIFMILAYRHILHKFNDTEYKSIIRNIFLIVLIFTVVNPFVFQQFFVSIFITLPFMAELCLGSTQIK